VACSPARSRRHVSCRYDRFGIKTRGTSQATIETFPEQVKTVAEAGHEVGLHGYTHENPIDMMPQQEQDVLDKCIRLITGLKRRY
jgi:peptidoglycan/xylan/chitin deacetylase (PgdA/CDA1 family)